MKLIDLAQGSPEWLEWRSKGITASDIPVILGLSPYKTPWRLWAEKTGLANPDDLSNNPHVLRGNRLEDKARFLAERKCDDLLLPVCGEQLKHPFLRASFDGLDINSKPHEFKAPAESTWSELNLNLKSSPTYLLYEAQVQAQCVVAGVNSGHLYFFMEDGRCLEFEVNCSPSKRDKIISEAERFHLSVVNGIEPVADPRRDYFIPDTPDLRKKWSSVSDLWRDNAEQIKTLKENLKALEEGQKGFQREMITMMGSYLHADVGGVKVSRYTAKGQVDYQKFLRAQFPDVDYSGELELFRKAPRVGTRFTMSENTLLNIDINAEVVSTDVLDAYF